MSMYQALGLFGSLTGVVVVLAYWIHKTDAEAELARKRKREKELDEIRDSIPAYSYHVPSSAQWKNRIAKYYEQF